MRHRSNSRRSSLFCGTKIQSSRRPENRCRRRYAAGSQLRRMRLSGLSGPGRRAGETTTIFRRSIARPAEPTRCKKIAEYLGKAVAGTGTDGRRGALQRLVATKRPAYERLQRSRRRAPIEAALYGGETGCAYGCLGATGTVWRPVSFRGHRRSTRKAGLPEVDETQVHGLRRLRKSLSRGTSSNCVKKESKDAAFTSVA